MLSGVYAFADEASDTLDGQVDALRRNHLSGLVLRNIDGRNVTTLTKDRAREIRRILDGAGLSVYSIGSSIGKIDLAADDFSAHVDTFCRTVELAQILGASRMRIFSFYYPKHMTAADCKNEVIDRLGILLSRSCDSGVRLCHENEKGIYGDTAARCAELLAALPDLSGVFDPANFVQCGEDTLAAWRLLRERTEEIHVKDADAAGRVCPCGKGEGHLPEILSDACARGLSFTIEPHLKGFKGLSALERAGARSGITDAYASTDEAFDAACDAFWKTMIRNGEQILWKQ